MTANRTRFVVALAVTIGALIGAAVSAMVDGPWEPFVLVVLIGGYVAWINRGDRDG
jgi:hypothetical protein